MSAVTVFIASFIAAVLIFIVLPSIVALYSSSTLMDLWYEDSWVEAFAYGSLAVVSAIFFSFINLVIDAGPPIISINITGGMAPLIISAFIIALRKVRLLNILMLIPLVALISFLLSHVEHGKVLIEFPYWLITSGIAGIGSFCLAESGDIASAASSAYVSASIGSFLGIDILYLFVLDPLKMNEFIMGAGGFLDYVFLSGVMAVAILCAFSWSLSALMRRNSRMEGI